MHSKTITMFLSVALLSVGATACGNKGKGKTQSPEQAKASKEAMLNPELATKAAKEDFAKAAKSYEAAKKDGKLSPAECEEQSAKWMQVYKKHGKQMAVAYFNAAAVWEECGDIEKAEKMYLQMTKEVPGYDMSYNNLGVIYWNRKQEAKALSYFKKAVEVNPRTNAPRNNLAAALRDRYSKTPDQKDFEAAEGHIQRVLAVDSNNRVAYENLARLYYDRGRLKDRSYLVLANLVVTQGIKVLKEAGLQSADLYNLKGLLLMEDNNQVEALKAFKKAVEVDPNHADANLNMALLAIRFRDFENGEKSFKIAARDRRHAKNIETFLGLGVAQRGLRKYGDAEKSFHKAEKLDSKDPRPLFNLGILYHEHLASQDDIDLEGIKKHYNTAKDYFQKFVQKAGNDKKYAASVADAKNRIEQIEESFRTWAEMAELERKAKELEELQRKQEEEEKKRLLEAEKRALEAAKRAEEAARKKAEEAAKKAEEKGGEAKKADEKKEK
ncbi:MAG: tetratricopeptide repeat protein [Deltaproteobacteria bacterium]|nr:MAG: tetratricopeptide repeat protein [Deltaproteobacteria bacterium]